MTCDNRGNLKIEHRLGERAMNLTTPERKTSRSGRATRGEEHGNQEVRGMESREPGGRCAGGGLRTGGETLPARPPAHRVGMKQTRQHGGAGGSRARLGGHGAAPPTWGQSWGKLVKVRPLSPKPQTPRRLTTLPGSAACPRTVPRHRLKEQRGHQPEGPGGRNPFP